MSWQSYVNDQLLGSGQLASAAIVDLSAGSVSAQSSSFPKGALGVCMAKTSTMLIIGVYGEQNQPGNAATVVEKLADYLVENGY
ncbi:hypothetical protein Sjap_019532 [Stephania japonica]|uniref:Profilin n=1 Tax=Stephania japonica TaxID=461633 RepID=A0AAP0F684_9MAGN